MSVSRGQGDRSENFDDLDKLHVQQTARAVNLSGGPALDRKLPDIDMQRSDTLSLENNEVAELVALHISGYRNYVDNNNYGADFNMRGGMSIAINYDDMAWQRDNDIETDNLGTDGELAGRTRLEDSGRILWTGSSTFINKDGGGGVDPQQVTDSDIINYRQQFGTGPVLDNQDSLTHGAFLRGVNLPTNTNAVQILDYTAYFDVFETERIYR